MTRSVAFAVAFAFVATTVLLGDEPLRNIKRAERLGPGSQTETSRARLYLVRQANDNLNSPADVSPPRASDQKQVAAEEMATLSELHTKWETEVVQPLADQRLESAIQLAEARTESYQARLDLLNDFNFYAPPDANRFSSAWVLPPADGIAPTTTSMPVQMFSPSSTFAHSLELAERRLEESELELAALQRRRKVNELPENRTPAPLTADDFDKVAETVEQIQTRADAVDAELELARFRQESLNRRAEQLDGFATLTYSNLFSDLGEDMRLGQLRAELKVADLEAERDLLEKHIELRQQLEVEVQRERVARREYVRTP